MKMDVDRRQILKGILGVALFPTGCVSFGSTSPPPKHETLVNRLKGAGLEIEEDASVDFPESEKIIIYIPEFHTQYHRPVTLQRIQKVVSVAKPELIGLEGLVGEFNEARADDYLADYEMGVKRNISKLLDLYGYSKEAIKVFQGIVQKYNLPIGQKISDMETQYDGLYSLTRTMILAHGGSGRFYLKTAPGVRKVGLESPELWNKCVNMFLSHQSHEFTSRRVYEYIGALVDEVGRSISSAGTDEEKRVAMEATRTLHRSLGNWEESVEGFKEVSKYHPWNELVKVFHERSREWVRNLAGYNGTILVVGGQNHIESFYDACRVQRTSLITLNRLEKGDWDPLGG